MLIPGQNTKNLILIFWLCQSYFSLHCEYTKFLVYIQVSCLTESHSPQAREEPGICIFYFPRNSSGVSSELKLLVRASTGLRLLAVVCDRQTFGRKRTCSQVLRERGLVRWGHVHALHLAREARLRICSSKSQEKKEKSLFPLQTAIASGTRHSFYLPGGD